MPAITVTTTTTDVLDLAGNAAATFIDQSVTNNVGVTGFEVNNDGDDININNATGAITFNPSSDPYGGAPYTTDHLGAALNVSMFDSVDAVCLVKIDIPTPAGDAVDDDITATPSLWLHPKDLNNGPTYVQKVGGVDVPAATVNTLTHTVTANSQGKNLTFAETFNGVTVESDPLAIFGTVFSPATIGGHLWADVSDISTLDQVAAGGTPVTTNGQTVERFTDKIEGVIFSRSGGDNTWDATNEQILLNGTGASEYVAQSDVSAISGMPTAGEFWMTLKTADPEAIIISTNNVSIFGFVIDEGQTAGHSSGLGSLSTRVIDGGIYSSTLTQRGQLFTALNVGRGVILRAQGFNATALANPMRLFDYVSDGFPLQGAFKEFAIMPALTDLQASDLATYFNGRLPQ